MDLKLPTRISLIGALQAGRTVEVRLLIGHAMDTGYRNDDQGRPVAKNILEWLRVSVGEVALFELDMGIAVAANPYLSFPLQVPPQASTLRVQWRDDRGQQGEVSKLLIPE